MFTVNKMKRPLQSKNAQKGVSLVELSISLAIIAVITIVGIIFANDALKESRLSSESARVNSVVMKSRAAFQSTALNNLSTSATTTLNAARLGVFPRDMLNKEITDTTLASTDINNRWGGSVALVSVPALSIMQLTYNKIPNSDCIEFTNRVSSLFSYISSKATMATAADADIKSPASPTVASDKLQAACANNDANVISFGYSK